MSWRDLHPSADGTHHLRDGRPAYDARFDAVQKFHAPGLAPVLREGVAWHIDTHGAPAYARRFRRTFGFYEGFAAVESDDGWHHITADGRDGYSARYAWCGNYQEQRCPARDTAGRYLHLDVGGVPCGTHTWRYAGDFRDGAAVVQGDDGRSTHVTHDGSRLHGHWFEDLDVFHKGLARARDARGWTHVDRTGRPVYARRFAMVEPFYNGQARVEGFDGRFEVIDASGVTLVELRPARRELSAVDWQVPPSVLRWLDEAPTDRPVALLLRHSVRPPLDPGDVGYTVPLTEVGVRLAQELGRRLGARLRTLHASPLLRCVQTAEALRAGSGRALNITKDRLLGDPGAFVHDGRLAGPIWRERGHEGVMAHLVIKDEALPGMAAPDAAARFLVHHMLSAAGGVPGVHVFATHDSLVTATAARLLREPLGRDAWPWYLEGAFFWRDGDDLHGAYRETRRACVAGPLCALNEVDVIEFARREVGAVLGLDCDARFFLAGGAFKTLLNGRAPRDLDLWAPSDEDRAKLIRALEGRGARRIVSRPFADVFETAGRTVEVPHRTEPDTLEARLARFDLALSAIGAEHTPGDRWRAVVHPLALTSVTRREVLLLKPLVNWKHALATLARLRRYAEELDFTVPTVEESEVWRVFDAQPREMQLGMLSRFDLASVGGHGVREEAAQRLRGSS